MCSNSNIRESWQIKSKLGYLGSFFFSDTLVFCLYVNFYVCMYVCQCRVDSVLIIKFVELNDFR